MFAFKPQTEIVIRVFLIAVMLVNALVPTVALAAPNQATDPISDKEVNKNLTTSLPNQEPLFFDPPQITYPQQTSPEGDEPPSPVPPKDQVEFTLTAEPAVVPVNGLVKFNVHIRNHSEQTLTSLVFRDALETGLEYSPDTTSPVTYDSKKKEVVFTINSLNVDQEFNFSYSVTVTSSKRNAVKGKAWLHNVELNSSKNNLQLKTGAIIAVQVTNINAKSELVPLNPEGGWNSLGRVAVHMEKENVGKNALVMSSPTKISGKGPALQFNLDVFETSSLATDSQSQLNEQAISLAKESQAKFKTPAFLEINLDGYVDLKNVPAGKEPYVATYDEAHKVWVKVPILESDLVANSVTVETAHFSTWGAGLGSSLPQNGANVLLFDQPYTSLFTGSSRYSIPIWTPSGRAGMQPDISLSYSSGTVDGVLGDVQAPWVGVGWNIDDVEIVRKITTDENGYGYKNEFALTLNGTLYQLVQDEFHPYRYFTDQAAFLYIERHNHPFGEPSNLNTTGEWWEVVTTDGTHYRLGWNEDSEQLALMYGYSCTTNGLDCITPDGAYASLGYAGKAQDLVALRWRVDRVSDTHGNYMEYVYHETQPDPATTLAPFDRESYLQSIRYTGFHDPENLVPDLAPAYQIVFSYGDRSTIGDVPTEFNIWDNLDSKYLSQIWSCYGECTSNGNNAIRKYHFGYSLANVPNPNGTLTLTSLNITGGGYTENGQTIPVTNTPTIRFTYQNRDNRASGNGDVFTYPRLVTLDNGTGGLLTFTYETDERGNNSWYNYRVQNVVVDSGMGIAKKQSYTYATPVYSGSGGNTTLGDLFGYTTVTESLLDFTKNDAAIVKTKHTFGTTGLDIGREMQTEVLDITNTVLRKTVNVYITDNSGAPKDHNGIPFPGWNYRYLRESASYEKIGSTLTLLSKNSYYNNPLTGNLSMQNTYLGNSLYRKTYYEYILPPGFSTNPDPEHYVLDKASRVVLMDASNQIYSDTRYYYDNYTGTGEQVITHGDLTWTQALTGSGDQTVDTVTAYNPYGSPTSGKAYRSYGTVSLYPSSAYWESTTTYDSVQNDPTQSYPKTMTNALGQSSSTAYLYTLGVPYQSVDPNGWTTSITYDGLGRTLSVTPPGLSQPGTWYIYPSPGADGKISAPHSVEMQILDTIAGKYRSVWGIYDGAGRMLQTQVDADNKLLVNTTLFNAQGLASQQSLPYEVNQAAGGNYIYSSGSQFTTTEYDALGRATHVTAPGGITSQTSYDGLTTISLDPNGNKISRTVDGLGRMISVAEFSNADTVYATTTYFYDSADRLIQVKDAKLTSTTIQYDWLGRKLGMDDPDMGIWSYGYDSLGNMTSQTDARNHTVTFVYDALNRLKTKSDDDSNTVDSTYTYGTQQGTIGLRIGMTDPSGSSSWSYSNYGRTVTETRTIGGESHWVTTTTDWLGRAINTSYDDGEIVSYTYDELGRPDQLASNRSNATLVDLAYNVLGQIEEQKLGNGTTITSEYDDTDENEGHHGTNRLLNRRAETNGTTQLDLSYKYDLNGNITRLTDKQLNETQFYNYDFLNRLTSAIGANGTPTAAPTNPETYGQQFEYDKVGNIEQINNWGTAPALPTVTETPLATLTPSETPTPTSTPTPYTYSSQPDGTAGADTYLLSTSATTNYGTATGLAIGEHNGAANQYARTLLKFDLSSIPANAVVTSATLSLWTSNDYSDNDRTIRVYRLKTAFDESSATWNESALGVNWETAGASGANDRESTEIGSVQILANETLGVEKQIILTPAKVQEFIDGTFANNGFIIVADTELNDRFSYKSSDTTTASNRPKLVVQYTVSQARVPSNSFASVKPFDPKPQFIPATRAFFAPRNAPAYQDEPTATPTDTPTPTGTATGTPSPTITSTPVSTNTPAGTSTPSFTPLPPTPIANNANTVALLHMNGEDGATTFTDETGRVWSPHGNVQIDTAQSKFGGASALFDGSGDYLTTADSDDFYFNSDFTVDFWVCFNSVSGTRYFFSQRDQVPPGHYVYFFYDNGTTLRFQTYNSSGAGVSAAWPWQAETGNWYHVALVRSGNTYRAFVDGVQVGSTVTDADSMPNVASPMYLGLAATGSYPLNGWLDDVRFTKGVARWTSNFTPPGSEHPYATLTPTVTATYTPSPTPVVVTGVNGSYTVSLLHMNGDDASNIFKDETGNIWTAAGNAQVDTDQSVFGGASARFDGNGNYLSSPDSDEFYLNGDFTIEARVRFNQLPTTGTTKHFFSQQVNADNFQYVGVQNSGGVPQLIIRARSGGTDNILILKNTNLDIGTWYHFAFVRQGNNYRIFQNGVQVGTTVTDASAIPNYAAQAQIGARNGTSALNGWIDEFRISKDIARWTSNFTPPDAEYVHEMSMSDVLMAHWDFEQVTQVTATVTTTPPATVVSDVASADLVDNGATLQNGATIVADGAQGQAVFFDGIDDSATVANQTEIKKNNSSFTLSAWIHPSSLVTDHTQYIVNKGVSTTDFDYGFITTSRSDAPTATPAAATATATAPANVDADGKLVFRVGDLTPNKIIGPVLPVNTWTLVTGVYDSIKGELRLYINGRLAAAEKVTGTVSMGTGALKFSPTGNLYSGKLDEVRFYSRALTDSEVAQLFGTFATPTPVPPIPPTAITPATETPVPTPLSENAKQWGTGADGDLVIEATATPFNINTHTSNGRSCADAVTYNVTSLGSTIANLSTTPDAGCLNLGDEVMLINLKSTGPNAPNAGEYEFLRVAAVIDSSVRFTALKTRWYGNAWHSDANIGLGTNQERVMLVRVPNYNNVTVNGTLTGNAYNGYKNGVVAFRVAGELTGTGTISASSIGYTRAILGSSTALGYSPGRNATYNLSSGAASNGGGGGHASVGKIGGDEETSGAGGSVVYGNPQLAQLFLGSGGGAANLQWYRDESGNWHANDGPDGGNGGGIVSIAAQTVNFTGSIVANGAAKPSNAKTVLRGGAGAGGSIRIEGDTVALGTVSAVGGSASDTYGYGGKGRIAIYYKTSLSVSASTPNKYSQVIGQAATATPTPTSIYAVPDSYGTGADGDLEVTTGTFNLSTDMSETRACADGISYSVTELTAASAKLSASPLAECLTTGDEVMLIHLLGTGVNIGKYEYLRVGGVVGNMVYFKTQKVNFYGANADDDSNIGTGTDPQRVMLLRVPNYENVTVNGILTTSAYSSYKSGVVAFRVHGTLAGTGSISASSKGFTVALGYSHGGNAPYNDYAADSANGGGGGHATTGKKGGTKDTDGAGGSVIYGNPQLSRLFFGSGGGAANRELPSGDPGPSGGNGGGIISIAARTINFTGSIIAGGATKPSNADTTLRGGAGAGGSIRIEGETIAVGGVSAIGGSSTDSYGYGGSGRIAIYYTNSLSGSETICAQAFTYCQNTSLPGTPTPAPVGTGIYDDANAAWVYSGTWTVAANTSAYAQTLHTSTDLNAAAAFTFTGTSFTLKYTRAANRGSYTVWVDGVNVDTFNAYNATNAYQSEYTLTGLSAGTHTVVFQRSGISGTYIDIDSIQIYDVAPVTATPSATLTPTASPTPVPQGWYESDYTYSTDAPHAVTSVNRGSYADTFTYDANGNMTCRTETGVTYKQEYNAENRISSIWKLASGTCTAPGALTDKWDFTYDGDGTRTVQLYTQYINGQPQPIATTRYYFGGAYETTNGVWKKYYSFGGTTLMRDVSGFKYFLSDQLGSVSVVLSDSGAILEQQRYLPFGQARVMPTYASITSTDFTYTGQRNIAGTGLMDYNARFYSPTLGRFTQPDTIIPNLTSSQSWNRYSYVLNNPIMLNDPTGHKACDDEQGCGGKLPKPTRAPTTQNLSKTDDGDAKGVGHRRQKRCDTISSCSGRRGFNGKFPAFLPVPETKIGATYSNNVGQPGDAGNYKWESSGYTPTIYQHNFNHVGGDGEIVDIPAEFPSSGARAAAPSGGSVHLLYGASYGVTSYDNLQVLVVRESYYMPSHDLPLVENETFGGSVLLSESRNGQRVEIPMGTFTGGNIARPTLTQRETYVAFWGSENFPTQLKINVSFGAENRGGVRFNLQLPSLIP